MGLAVIFAYLQSEVAFTHGVIERADFELVAPQFVALDSFVLVRVVKSLDGGVALAALEAARAQIPADTRDQGLAVLGIVFEEVRWSPEVTHVVRVDAPLGIM